MRPTVNITDLVTGLLIAAICGVAAWMAAGYELGTPRRMGAGFFPFMLGLTGVALGAVIAGGAVLLPRGEVHPRPDMRQLLHVTAAFLIFGFGIDILGLPITIVLATMVAARGDRASTLREALLLGIGLAFGIWLIFVQALGLAIPVLPELG